MTYESEKIIDCNEFEERLTDYLDKNLDPLLQKACAAHALKCPLCHSLLNEVKSAVEVCHELNLPNPSMTRLEARIISMTAPESAMACQEFENYLTDYLDGFLPATLFHRWERHAICCNKCEDLPGEVVRSLATLISYKSEELPIPEGLHNRILQSTIGTANAAAVKASWISQAGEWVRSWQIPISIPQLAPIAMMLVFAFMILTQTVSADGSISGAYQKSLELAQETYQQTADVWNESKPEQKSSQAPIEGTYIKED